MFQSTFENLHSWYWSWWLFGFGWICIMEKKIETEPIKTVVIALAQSNKQILSKLYTFLIILVSLPITTATSLRLFSTFKRWKNPYSNNTTSENRFNGLTLLNIHCGIEISVE